MEGRDIGSVVFPDAELKIFLTASPEIRAERRWREHQQKGDAIDLARTLDEIRERDRRDREREDSPLVRAKDAVVVDSTAMEAGGSRAARSDAGAREQIRSLFDSIGCFPRSSPGGSMKSLSLIALMLAVFLSGPSVFAQAPAAGNNSSDVATRQLREFLAKDWKYWMHQYPESATAFGYPGENAPLVGLLSGVDRCPQPAPRRCPETTESNSSRRTPRERAAELRSVRRAAANSGRRPPLSRRPVPDSVGLSRRIYTFRSLR